MSKDFPDNLGWEGRSAVGEEVSSITFGPNDIGTEATGTWTIATVPAGYEYIFQHVTIASSDDSAIHYADLYQDSDNTILFSTSFITRDNAEFPGRAVVAGDVCKLEITNNATETVSFLGTISWTKRPV